MSIQNINPRTIFDYVSMANPTVDVNPKILPVTWLNMTTGEMFVCTNKTEGFNVWVGSLGNDVPFFYRDLVAWYPLTEDATDRSSGENNGTIVGSPSFGTDGATFNGTDETILLFAPDLSLGTIVFDFKGTATSFPISCWKDTLISTTASLYYGVGSITSVHPDESCGFIKENPYNTFKHRHYIKNGHTAYTDGTIRRFALTIGSDGTPLHYVDGTSISVTPDATAAGSFLNNLDGAVLSVCARKIWNPTETLGYWPGTVRNVKVFNRVLTPEEVALA